MAVWRQLRGVFYKSSIVMAGLVPAIHTLGLARNDSDRGYGSPGTSPGMTVVGAGKASETYPGFLKRYTN